MAMYPRDEVLQDDPECTTVKRWCNPTDFAVVAIAKPGSALAAYEAGQVVEQTIRTKAAQALAANKTFLAIASPSNAQVGAQVKSLTRQVNGLLRLALADYSDSTDS